MEPHQPHSVPQRGPILLTARSQALLYEPTPLLQPSPRTRSPALDYSQLNLASISSIASGSAVISRATTRLVGPADKREGDALLGVTFEVEPWPSPTLGALS
jgi:hypothetical protein